MICEPAPPRYINTDVLMLATWCVMYVLFLKAYGRVSSIDDVITDRCMATTALVAVVAFAVAQRVSKLPLDVSFDLFSSKAKAEPVASSALALQRVVRT